MMLFVFANVAVYLSRPLYDPDFYWHLKTGQWIWQHGSLPHMDTFGIPPFPDSSPRTEFHFTSYWLLQLIMFAFYSLWGMTGIIIFRWLISGIFLLAFIRWTDVLDSNVSAVLAIGTILLLELYFIERPQFISFVCFGILLVILFRFLDQSGNKTLWRTLVPLTLLMTIWANMHGGFLIGQAILVYCVIAESIKFYHPSLSPLSKQNFKILLISGITALIASFINPNAVNLIKYMPIIFDANHYSNTNNLEQLSAFAYLKESHDKTVILYFAVMVLTAGTLLASRYRKNITWLGILAGTAFMGYQHMRLMPFFLVSATLFVTKFFETEYPAIKARLALFAMLVVTTIYCVGDEFKRVHEVTQNGWIPVYQFPVRSADFIANNNISGNTYTTVYWGGYMIWRTGPENRIFHDGRMLNVQRAWEYSNSKLIVTEQRPYWKGLFNMYDIRIVILPIYEDDGTSDGLTQSIAADQEWKMVFAAENEAVFVRK